MRSNNALNHECTLHTCLSSFVWMLLSCSAIVLSCLVLFWFSKPIKIRINCMWLRKPVLVNDKIAYDRAVQEKGTWSANILRDQQCVWLVLFFLILFLEFLFRLLVPMCRISWQFNVCLTHSIHLITYFSHEVHKWTHYRNIVINKIITCRRSKWKR